MILYRKDTRALTFEQFSKTGKVENLDHADFSEEFDYCVSSGVSEVVVTLMDWNRLHKDAQVGSVSIPLDDLSGGVQQHQHLVLNIFKAPSPHSPKVQVVGQDNTPTAFVSLFRSN